ncbi:MAG: cofactor-independent phosphoglycerate mutase [Candidatus Margulisiibacteriota bacterium]|nr:cofactor-independent phosphoglycerate mutase [Candidatus Margulisiibacteriota bacterium]
MKYIVLIGDGMSDLPLKELKGRTPLEAAKTPNMDRLAQMGACGMVSNVPAGMAPGSDIANMSIFGYDPKKYYSGRGPLEAVSLGIKLKKGEFAFRCNLVTIRVNVMEDFTAGHISTAEAKKLIKMLDKTIGSKNVRFYPGLSYRHIAVFSGIKDDLSRVECTPPHDITGKQIERYLPSGKGSEKINYLMSESTMYLLEDPVNIARMDKKQRPANMIWLWGQGKTPSMPSFKKIYNKKAAVITAVHLLKGMAATAGMTSIDVPGATGFLDTNYEAKASYALKALKKHDIVFVHVEAPDECGHMGDTGLKVRAIEDFDRKIVGKIFRELEASGEEFKMLVLPDHPTPIKVMSHTADPVPFVIFCSDGSGRGKYSQPAYSEKNIKKSGFSIKDGHQLIGKRLFCT